MLSSTFRRASDRGYSAATFYHDEAINAFFLGDFDENVKAVNVYSIFSSGF